MTNLFNPNNEDAKQKKVVNILRNYKTANRPINYKNFLLSTYAS